MLLLVGTGEGEHLQVSWHCGWRKLLEKAAAAAAGARNVFPIGSRSGRMEVRASPRNLSAEVCNVLGLTQILMVC